MPESLTCRQWLERCVDYHGHYCMGQALGIRLALKGIDLAAPGGPKDLVVVVENERCIVDAIQIVTGTRIGRRSMKLVDYGKMAATFLNVATGRAFRVNVRKVDPTKASSPEAKQAVLDAPEDELLSWNEVKLSLRPEDLPGKPHRTVNCVRCGEKVFDAKDVETPEGAMCLACANGPYYEKVQEGP